MSDLLELRNPHAVLAALQRRPQDVAEVRLPPAGGNAAWRAAADVARRRGVLVTNAPPPEPGDEPGRGDRRGDRRGGRPGRTDTGGKGRERALAYVAEREPVAIEELFTDAVQRDGGRGLWLALDAIQDPHNVGAVFRSAAFFGVQGVLMLHDRAAPISAVVYDVSAGGVEVVPFAIETNLRRSLRVAQDAGCWVLGSSEDAPQSMHDVDTERPWVLVLGNEEQGLRRLTRETCDDICAIPTRGEVGSLNVSVAAGVLMSHLTGGRTRGAAGGAQAADSMGAEGGGAQGTSDGPPGPTSGSVSEP